MWDLMPWFTKRESLSTHVLGKSFSAQRLGFGGMVGSACDHWDPREPPHLRSLPGRCVQVCSFVWRKIGQPRPHVCKIPRFQLGRGSSIRRHPSFGGKAVILLAILTLPFSLSLHTSVHRQIGEDALWIPFVQEST